jgi:hypothetical protein
MISSFVLPATWVSNPVKKIHIVVDAVAVAVQKQEMEHGAQKQDLTEK